VANKWLEFTSRTRSAAGFAKQPLIPRRIPQEPIFLVPRYQNVPFSRGSDLRMSCTNPAIVARLARKEKGRRKREERKEPRLIGRGIQALVNSIINEGPIYRAIRVLSANCPIICMLFSRYSTRWTLRRDTQRTTAKRARTMRATGLMIYAREREGAR